jgi:hypothetical protein
MKGQDRLSAYWLDNFPSPSSHISRGNGDLEDFAGMESGLKSG